MNAGIRGKGIGRTLVETFIDWSKLLGYTSSFSTHIWHQCWNEKDIGGSKF